MAANGSRQRPASQPAPQLAEPTGRQLGIARANALGFTQRGQRLASLPNARRYCGLLILRVSSLVRPTAHNSARAPALSSIVGNVAGNTRVVV